MDGDITEPKTVNYTIRFRGFNIRFSQPIDLVDSAQIDAKREDLLFKVSDVLGPDKQYDSQLRFANEPSSRTNLCEISLRFQSSPPLAEIWNWIYKLRQKEDIDFVEPRFSIFDITSGKKGETPELIIPTKIKQNKKWHLEILEIEKAWENHFPQSDNRLPGQGVVIAQPDSGFLLHDALLNVLWRTIFKRIHRDYVDGDGVSKEPEAKPNSNPKVYGHGTSVASLIFGKFEDGKPLGVAYGAEPVFYRATIDYASEDDLEDNSELDISSTPLARSIENAVRKNVDIISISLGGFPNLLVRRAILNAQSKGIIVVASAGNNLPFAVWPSVYNQVIAVASSTYKNTLARHSARGSRINIAAPGDMVWCATSKNWTEHSYEPRSGTSFATPLIAGLAALWLSRWGGRDNLRQRYEYEAEQIPIVFEKLLRESCIIPNKWDARNSGAGIANAFSLLEAELPSKDDLSIQIPVTLNLEEDNQLDTGQVLTFLHLFEMTLIDLTSDRKLTTLRTVLCHLLEQSENSLDQYLNKFGQELSFHLGYNSLLYEMFSNALKIEIGDLDEVLNPLLAELRENIQDVASSSLQRALNTAS